MTAPARTVFFGTGAFAVPTLRALVAAHDLVSLVGVVTAPPRPAGRGLQVHPSPVAEAAHALGIDDSLVLTPRTLRDAATQEALAALRPDLLVLADYGRIVPEAILALPPFGALNVHPSLLPRHRGATPVPAAILAGDTETGVTLIAMDPGVDTGPIVARRSMDLMGDELAPALEARLAATGADLLADTLGGWLAGEIHPLPQPDEGATLSRPLRRTDGALDPALPAERLARQVRAYRPWPGSHLKVGGARLVVEEATALPGGAVGASPGTLVALGDGLGLATSEGVLELVRVRPAGKRTMSGVELRRGRPGLVGTRSSDPR